MTGPGARGQEAGGRTGGAWPHGRGRLRALDDGAPGQGDLLPGQDGPAPGQHDPLRYQEGPAPGQDGPAPGLDDPARAAERPSPLPARPGRNPWKMGFFLLAAAGAAAAAVWLVFGSPLLAVRSVQVTGTRLVPRWKVLAAADIPLGIPLIRVNTAAAATRIERIAQVRTARVIRDWPDRVVISVQDRTPVLAVPLTDGRLALVDPSGVTVRQVSRPPAGIPRMYLTGPLAGNPGVRDAASVLRAVPASVKHRIRLVSIAGGAVTLHLSGGITVDWGTRADPARKARELAILLRTHARYYDVSGPGTAVTG